MNKLLASIASIALAGISVAQQQMPLPAFTNTFTGTQTRGFYFQAPADALISGLEVPNEAGQPFQVVEVIDFGATAPPVFSASVIGTQLFYNNNTASGQIIPAAVPLVSGNWYGILGGCNDAQGSATTYNSYGAGNFTSDFLGTPVTLNRLVTQSGIAANGGNQPCSTEAGPIARVEVYLQETGQMPLPAFTNTYTSTQTRGFYFQAPADALISGLEVPNEAGQPFQVVEVIDFGATAPPVFSASVTGTQLFYNNNTASGQIIPAAVPLVSGNWYGILGGCNDAQGSATTYNSYGAGDFTSDFLGTPVTLSRLLTQSGIAANGGNQPCSASTGPIARVEVYLDPAPGIVASNTTLGSGCGGLSIGDGTAYEQFSGSTTTFDLSGTGHTYLWNGNGYVLIDGAGAIVAPTNAPTAFGDDDTQSVALPFGLPCAQGIINDVFVCSNGYMSFENTTVADYSESVPEFLNQFNRLAFLWDDLNPSASGTINLEAVSASEFHITFTDVPEYGTAAGLNNVQVVLLDTGDIQVRYGSCTLQDALVGLSTGNGASDPGATDFSDLGTIGPVSFNTGVGPFYPDVSLVADTRPILGSSWDLTVQDIPVYGLFGVNFFGLSNPALPLGFLGLPGCGLFADLGVVDGPWFPIGGNYSYSFAVPATSTALLNFELFTQSAVFGAPNAFGAVTSNGVKGTVGDI